MAWRILWADGWGFTNCPLALRKAGPVLPPCLQGAFVCLSFLSLFNRLNYFQPPLAGTIGIVAAIALIATLVEALPFRDIDNLTLTGVAVALGLWWF